MALREYTCRFVDETAFIGRRYAYDPDEEKYAIRLFEARLTVTPEFMFANIDTANGIQVLWQHGSMSFFGGDEFQAVGRVLSMEFEGKALVGTIGLSEPDVARYVAGGFGAIDARVNTGLSIGVQFLDQPPVTWTLGKGTRESPDKMRYGRVRISEVSMTPIPRIHTAGIVAPVKKMEDDADSDSDDDPEDMSHAA